MAREHLPPAVDSTDATIASGASLSGAVDMIGHSLTGIQMPAAWTAASLTFQVSNDNSTFVDLYWNGAEYEITAAGGATTDAGISLEPSALAGWRYLKVRSGTSSSAVNQGAERTIGLLTRHV